MGSADLEEEFYQIWGRLKCLPKSLLTHNPVFAQALVALDFGPEHALGTVSFSSKICIPMKKYLVKLSARGRYNLFSLGTSTSTIVLPAAVNVFGDYLISYSRRDQHLHLITNSIHYVDPNASYCFGSITLTPAPSTTSTQPTANSVTTDASSPRPTTASVATATASSLATGTSPLAYCITRVAYRCIVLSNIEPFHRPETEQRTMMQ